MTQAPASGLSPETGEIRAAAQGKEVLHYTGNLKKHFHRLLDSETACSRAFDWKHLVTGIKFDETLHNYWIFIYMYTLCRFVGLASKNIAAGQDKMLILLIQQRLRIALSNNLTKVLVELKSEI